MQALMIYTSKCNNLNTLRYDVLFILRLINKYVLFIFITQLLVGPPVETAAKISYRDPISACIQPVNWWKICLSMREQNEQRNCVEYTQRVFTKRHNRVNIAKCLYKINDCFMLKMDMI
jgi:hypothetical protein